MNAKKAVAIALSLLLVFVMLFSLLFLIAEAEHDCIGEDCPICQIIAILEDTLKGFSLLVCLVILAFAAQFTVGRILASSNQSFFHFTPVLLKVKLSN